MDLIVSQSLESNNTGVRTDQIVLQSNCASILWRESKSFVCGRVLATVLTAASPSEKKHECLGRQERAFKRTGY